MKINTLATWYVGFWLVITTSLGSLALVVWSLRTLGLLP
jgi:hypothetical protein